MADVCDQSRLRLHLREPCIKAPATPRFSRKPLADRRGDDAKASSVAARHGTAHHIECRSGHGARSGVSLGRRTSQF